MSKLNLGTKTTVNSKPPTLRQYARTAILGAVVAQLFVVQSHAQMSNSWVARYNGPAVTNADDQAKAMVLDHAGNVYVTGSSIGSSGKANYATVKYDPNGNQMWVARYPATADTNYYYPVALALDREGNVIVTGKANSATTSWDCVTIKYDPDGNQLWTARYSSPGYGLDYPVGVGVDDADNVYVVGYTSNWGTLYFVTMKYDPNGNRLWLTNYYPDYISSVASGMAVDQSGNVYVTGTWNDACITVKYDSAGNQLWVARYRGLRSNGGSAVALDSAGNVLVTGASQQNGNEYEIATVKYDNAGNQLWVARYGGPASTYCQARFIAVDSHDNVYVAGTMDGGRWIALIKYDENGNQLWERHGSPSLLGMALDMDGNLYVAGNDSDYVIVKYDPNGNPLWMGSYDGPAHGDDGAKALATDAAGNVYVTGGSQGVGTWSDFATLKYVPAPGPPMVFTEPTQQLAPIGGEARFTMLATGTQPLTYQWQKDGVNLTDGVNITGATTNTLQITSVSTTDRGSYSVFITNAYGSVTSVTANLVLVTSPQVNRAFTLPDGNVEVDFNATPNVPWRIQAATNLTAAVNWVTVTNLTSLTDTLQFKDMAATNYPQRFYRAVWP